MSFSIGNIRRAIAQSPSKTTCEYNKSQTIAKKVSIAVDSKSNSDVRANTSKSKFPPFPEMKAIIEGFAKVAITAVKSVKNEIAKALTPKSASMNPNEFPQGSLDRMNVSPATKTQNQEEITKASSNDISDSKLKTEAKIQNAKQLDPDILKQFSEVNSSKLEDSKQDKPTVVVTASSTLAPKLLENGLKNKIPNAIGVKFESNESKITKGEAALAQLRQEIMIVEADGDHGYKDNCHVNVPHDGKKRTIILCTNVHPDFEKSKLTNNEVTMRLIKITDEPLEGIKEPENFEPFFERKDNEKYSNDYYRNQPKGQKELEKAMDKYDRDEIQAHRVYKDTKSHRLPSLKEIKADKKTYKLMDSQQAIKYLVKLIENPKMTNISDEMENKFVTINNEVISLEVLFNLYVEQVRNEFCLLEVLAPQGYVYTLDPPKEFVKALGEGNERILNRLQLLAMKQINSEHEFENLKKIGVNNFADPKLVGLYKNVFSKRACAKADLIGEDGKYNIKDNYAIVEHNNSDGVGNNLLSEGRGNDGKPDANKASGSKDGWASAFTNAYKAYKEDKIQTIDKHMVI